MTHFFDECDLISVYTRAQAIEDGFLIDVSEMAREAGFKFPVALTHTAYEDCVAWSDDDNRRKKTVQDVSGRLWDVLWMARLAVRRSNHDTTWFQLYRVPREGRGQKARKTTLKAICGPGDNGEQVIAIMLPNED